MPSVELRVLAGGGIAGPMRDIGPLFERASGHRVTFHFGTTPELVIEATSGTPFDCAVTPKELFDNAAARGRFAPEPPTDIARVGLGIAVRAGAAKPSIDTSDALKSALLGAQSLATIPASAAGAQILRVFERLGIADAMAAKTLVQKAPPDIVRAVTSGEAELGAFLANVLIAPGLELLAPFPAELQHEVVFAAAISAQPRAPEAARAFLAFLATPAASTVLTSKGMTPASPIPGG
jgi:molybdate transport system substrate-binding protein